MLWIVDETPDPLQSGDFRVHSPVDENRDASTGHPAVCGVVCTTRGFIHMVCLGSPQALEEGGDPVEQGLVGGDQVAHRVHAMQDRGVVSPPEELADLGE